MNDVDDESEPDPSREGIDWIRTEHGDLRHPLQHICREGLGAFQRVDVRGMLPDEYPAYRDELLRLMDAYRA